MEDMAEASIDDILKSIREAIVEKERKKYFKSFLSTEMVHKSALNDDIVELSKTMLVKREDIPYQLGVWSFDDVAKKMMKKYRTYFNCRPQLLGARVRVKEGK